MSATVLTLPVRKKPRADYGAKRGSMSATVLTFPVRKKPRAEAEIFCDRKKAERTRQLREDLLLSVMDLELEAIVEANVSAMMLELGTGGR